MAVDGFDQAHMEGAFSHRRNAPAPDVGVLMTRISSSFFRPFPSAQNDKIPSMQVNGTRLRRKIVPASGADAPLHEKAAQLSSGRIRVCAVSLCRLVGAGGLGFHGGRERDE